MRSVMLMDKYYRFSKLYGQTNLEDFTEAIITGDFGGKDFVEIIARIRGAPDPELKDRLKKSLPAITTAGTFVDGVRKRGNIEKYSHLVVIDYDGETQEDAKAVKRILSADPFIRVAAISPGGDGVKAWVEVDTGAELHEKASLEVYRYIEKEYNLNLDESVRGIQGLTFMTYDPECHANDEAQVFRIKESFESPISGLKPISGAEKGGYYAHPKVEGNAVRIKGCNLEMEAKIEAALMAVESKSSFKSGNRNRHTHLAASFLNNAGVPKEKALACCFENYGSGRTNGIKNSEVEGCVESAYKRKDQFGSFRQTDSSDKPQKGGAKSNHPFERSPYLPDEVFKSLPRIIKNVIGLEDDKRQRDILFLAISTILSSVTTNVKAFYGSDIGTCLYTFIVAPPASGKSGLDKAKKAAMIVDEDVERKNQVKIAKYKEAKKLFESNRDGEDLVEPKRLSFLLSGNSSGAGLIQDLQINEGKGLIMETEADTVANADQSTWGNLSQIYRQGFHHETISVSRKDAKVKISNPAFAVCLSGTPNQIRNMISSVEDGLISRFIFYPFVAKPVWNNQFARKNKELQTAIESLGNDLLGMMEFYSVHPMGIEFSDEQKTRHFDLFNELISDLEASDHIVGSIKRLGIIAIRFAMIFTAIRIYENREPAESTLCLDADFDNALALSKTFLEYTKRVFGFLGSSKSINQELILYDSLNDEFTTREAIEKGDEIGMISRKVERVLHNLMGGRISKRSHGKYFKNEMA